MISTNFNLLTLLTSINTDLRADAERSLRVPQYGPYHNEGPFMDSHLELIVQALGAVIIGEFDSRVPLGVRDCMYSAAKANTSHLGMYTMLHDLDKANCLTLVSNSGEKQAVSWEEWKHLLTTTDYGNLALNGDGEALVRFCLGLNLKQISYYQDLPEGKRTHGKVTADRLRGRADIPEIVVMAIETHEVAFQFGSKGGINIPLFEKNFASWTPEQIGFMLLVNYGDQMGSRDSNGQPDISDFVLLAKTFLGYQNFNRLTVLLESAEGLDKGKVTKAIDTLRKATDAFQAEDVEAAYRRIITECAIPAYDEFKLRLALAPIAAKHSVLADLMEPVITALVSAGQIPPELGRQLGPANKDIRTAIAGCFK